METERLEDHAFFTDAKRAILMEHRLSQSLISIGLDLYRMVLYHLVLMLSTALNGIGLRVLEESNVIIRNVKISKVLADVGDAIGIQEASNVWVDHVDLSSDLDHDKD